MVRYYNTGGFDVNGVHYQSPSPYHITWWGIFNEPNGNGLTASQYVTLYNLVVPAMQAVDPTIKFVAIEESDYGTQSQHLRPDLRAAGDGPGGCGRAALLLHLQPDGTPIRR